MPGRLWISSSAERPRLGVGAGAQLPCLQEQPIVVAPNPQPLPPSVAPRVIRRDSLTAGRSSSSAGAGTIAAEPPPRRKGHPQPSAAAPWARGRTEPRPTGRKPWSDSCAVLDGVPLRLALHSAWRPSLLSLPWGKNSARDPRCSVRGAPKACPGCRAPREEPCTRPSVAIMLAASRQIGRASSCTVEEAFGSARRSSVGPDEARVATTAPLGRVRKHF